MTDLRLTNLELQADRIPQAGDDHAVARFAHTFDGYAEYGGFNESAELANEALELYDSTGQLPATLTQLRNCLFFEHRRWRHFGEEPDPRAQAYVDALLGAIRAKVVRGELE